MTNPSPVRSVGVVATIGHRDPMLLRNLMRTLAAQTRLPDALAVVNFGDPCPELASAQLPFRYVYRHLPQPEAWSLSLAGNQGVRLLPPVESLLFLDADILLAPNFIESGMRKLEPGRILNCLIRDLPKGAVTPQTDVVREFEKLKKLSTPRREITAVGACQWIRTKAFVALRGRDEGFKMWCFEDMDLQRRARWLGLQAVHLDGETTMLHQWHRSKDDVLKDRNAPQVEAARYWYRKNLERLRNRAVLWDVDKFRAEEEVNPEGWGSIPPR